MIVFTHFAAIVSDSLELQLRGDSQNAILRYVLSYISLCVIERPSEISASSA